MKYAEFLKKINNQAPPDPVAGLYFNPSMISRVDNVDVEACEQVCQGTRRRLDVAFNWDSTPQGYNYWSQVCDGDQFLSDSGRAFITQLIEHHNAYYEGDDDEDLDTL